MAPVGLLLPVEDFIDPPSSAGPKLDKTLPP